MQSGSQWLKVCFVLSAHKKNKNKNLESELGIRVMPKGVQRHSILFTAVRTLIACAVSMFHIKDLKVIKMIHFLLLFLLLWARP